MTKVILYNTNIPDVISRYITEHKHEPDFDAHFDEKLITFIEQNAVHVTEESAIEMAKTNHNMLYTCDKPSFASGTSRIYIGYNHNIGWTTVLRIQEYDETKMHTIDECDGREDIREIKLTCVDEKHNIWTTS